MSRSQLDYTDPVLDKTERQFFPGGDVGTVLQSIQSSLYQHGIATHPTGPSHYAGRAAQARWGIAPKVCLIVYPTPGGFVVDASVAADFHGTSLVVLVLAWLVFFPAAVICALLAYQDWQKRQAELLAAVWRAVARQIAAPVPTMGPGGPPLPPGPPAS